MSKSSTTYKWPTIIGGLICCLGIAGCTQPWSASQLPLNAASTLRFVDNEEPPLNVPAKPATAPELTVAQLFDELLPDPALPDEVPVPEISDELLFGPDSDTEESSSTKPVKPETPAGNKAELVKRGREAFNTTCTQCHEADTALTVKQSHGEWIETINEMVDIAESDGLEIESREIVPIATYLAQRTDVEVEVAKAVAAALADRDVNAAAEAKDGDNVKQIDGETAFNNSCLVWHFDRR